MRKAKQRYDKYVNSIWKEIYGDREKLGLDACCVPSDQEAITGCKRLYRKFMGRSWKGKIKITSGNRNTWFKPVEGRYCMFINPNEKRWNGFGGWAEIVHSFAHWIADEKFDAGHDTKQLWLEAKMARYVKKYRFCYGALKSKPRKIPVVKDVNVEKLENIEKKLARWTTKLKRANTAIKKLNKQRKYYENKINLKEVA